MKSMSTSFQVMSPFLKGWSILRVDAWTEMEVIRSVAIVRPMDPTLF